MTDVANAAVTVTEHYAAKAADIEQNLVARYAVPRETLDALREAHFREANEEARLATASLAIGSANLEQVARALAELRKQKTP